MSWNMLQGIMKSAVERGLERRSLSDLNKATNEVRRSEHARLLGEGNEVLKGTPQLWFYGSENRSDTMLPRFETIA